MELYRPFVRCESRVWRCGSLWGGQMTGVVPWNFDSIDSAANNNNIIKIMTAKAVTDGGGH